MSNIHFNSIELNNFMSYEHEDFSFDRSGYILISGMNHNRDDSSLSNGSGKSSLFSALCWCLTGETPSGNKKVENIYLDGETYVELNFDVDSNNYIIRRCKNPSNLFITINGENKSGKGIRDSEKLLNEYLPEITSSLINSVIVLGQGLPQRFSNNTPSGRKEVLEKLSNSDFMISDLRSRLDSRKSALDSKALEYNNSVIEVKTQLSILDSNITKNTNALNSINASSLELELDELKFKRDSIKDSIDNYTAAKEECDVLLNSSLSSLQKIDDEYKEEFCKLDLVTDKELEDDLITITELKSSLTSKKNEILKLDSIKDVCPTCGQKIPGVVKIDTSQLKKECAELESDIELYKSNLNTKKDKNKFLIDSLDSVYDEKRKTINSNLSTIRHDIDSFTSIISSKEIESKEVSDKIIKIETELANINNTINILTKSIEDDTAKRIYLEKRLEELELNIEDISNRLNIVSKMNSLIKREFRGYLLSNIIEFISEKSKIYSQKVFNTEKLDFKLNGNNILISYDNKEYESLSGGEKQKVDVIIQLALRDMLCKYLNFSSNILVLDEITDSLDIIGSQNILNLISSELSDVESIYIISHHTDFDIPWDDEIVVVKDENRISRIMR